MNVEWVAKVKKLIAQTIAIRDDVYSMAEWTAFLNERMMMSGITDDEEYFNRLLSDPQELQELIELVVVTETWFYRDAPTIMLIVKKIRQMLAESSYQRVVRILSVPCSSGEEPLSIAMEAKRQGVPFQRLLIDGIDISRKSLAKGMLGLYGLNSFRGDDLWFRDAYFTENEGLYEVRQELRDVIGYHYGNLADAHFKPPHKRYDIVICRNLLIYLDVEAQQRAMALLDQYLDDHGLLCVSVAEGEAARKCGFHPVQEDSKVIYYSKVAKKKEKRALPAPVVRRKPQSREPVWEPSLLEQAKEKADNGSYEEAAVLCRTYLTLHGVNPRAYLMLGLIKQAQGSDEQAETLYRKAIYLDPNLYEALINLALLAEKNRDEKQARLFRERAERCLS